MLKALKFVKGAVAKKDYQPALTHFRIANGRVIGFNGTIALSSPIDLDIEATPKALPFVKAIELCASTTVAIHMTPVGRLALKAGGFKVFIDCSDEGDLLDSIVPQGEDVPIDSGFLAAIKRLLPYTSNDASRLWAMGVLLRGQSAYATNNIVLLEYWIGSPMPDINLPASAILELNRINEQPIKVRLSENSVTFFFQGDRWLRSQLLSVDWPDISALLDKAFEGADLQPIPPMLFGAVEMLAPFVDLEGRIYFRDNILCTGPEPEGGVGASMAMEGLPAYGAYHHKHIASLNGCATDIDFTRHPNPCPFIGEKLRGVFLGMVDA